MARSTMAFLMLMALLLVFSAPKYTVAQLRSMCISQFALANQACAVLPTMEAVKDLNQTRVQLAADNDDDDGDDDDDGGSDEDDDESRRRRGDGHMRRHRRGNGHRTRQNNGTRHDNEHSEEPRADRDCCRWMEEVDSSCVCTALLRLPPFLVRPYHEYSIKVGNACSRNFKCGRA